MNVRKFALPLAFALAFIVFFFASSIPIAHADDPSAAPKACPGSWSILGNCATVPGTNFLGTTDNQALVIKTNNAERVRILNNGKVGIATNAPATTLQVNGVTALGPTGNVYAYQVSGPSGLYPTIGFNTVNTTYNAGVAGFGGILQFQNGDGKLVYYTGSNVAAGAAHANTPRFAIASNGRVGIGTTNPTSQLEIAAQDGLAITGYQPYLTLRDANAGGARTIIQGANGDMGLFTNSFIGGTPPVQIKNGSGNVGIGTSAPTANLTVVRGGAPQPNVQGVATAFKVGSPAGSIPFALKQNAAESGTPTLAYFETNNGDLGYLGANAGTLVLGGVAGKALGFNVNGTTRGMTIASNGVVAIGTTNPTAWVHIKSTGTTNGSFGLRVSNANGDETFAVRDDGRVKVGHLGGSDVASITHICINNLYIVTCRSAGEYVPSIDGGNGFPETSDLVSIAPSVKNPYGDEHGPFTVQKSSTACDPNLLGFVVDPEKGADGVKLNDHYLPLAIFGYFPAKVTMLNGAIQRGDPLTSSDKPGYAMKATGACKIIGYALQDANIEGTIQVFAHLSENTAPQVAALQGQVDTLTQENLALKNELASIEARLAALEKGAPATQNSSQQTSLAH